jgi:DNA-directed RNA polymerase subunit H (RpoH/RPB5)
MKKNHDSVQKKCLALLSRTEFIQCQYQEISSAVNKMMRLRGEAKTDEVIPQIGFVGECDDKCHLLILAYTNTVLVVTQRSKLGMQNLKMLVAYTEQTEKAICIVSKHGVTTFAAHSPVLSNRRIKVLTWDRVFINPFCHDMVPHHVLLAKDEALHLVQMLRVRWCDLPRLKSNDACVCYMGWNAGQVVKVQRENGEFFLRLIV